MIALYARFSSKNQIISYLQIAVMIGLFSAFSAQVVHAEMDQEAFGHLSLNKKWQGDFHGMVERRVVRVLVVHDKVGFFIDRGHYRGVNADLLKAFEKFINRENRRKVLQIDVILLPVYHGQLIPALLEGIGDIAVGNLTISEDRLQKVDFSRPFVTDVKKIVITNSRIPFLGSIDDLSGQNIHIRKSSSSYKHALELNEIFKKKGVKPMKIIEADEHVEDADLLQMVNNGLIGMTVVDDHIARFWGKIYKDIKLYQDIALNEGGDIGWAFRKNSPQ
ncbi:MAG: transporter substrate-binding domain-containing protein, partial [Desulfofustis sp.]|nr:transporter substrate-binding domain-containing protein [Desulfofustis sp.]